MRASGEFDAMPKKEALLLSRELEKLERNLGGIAQMEKLPDAVFILDTKKEHIGVTEANKLGIPIVAVVDTNCDPDVIQYVIPGNDDAIRSGNLMCRVIADAVEEGRFIAVPPRRRRPPRPRVERTEDDEARVAAEQAEARRQALLAQQEREARLAAGRRPPPPEPVAEAPVAEAARRAEAAAAERRRRGARRRARRRGRGRRRRAAAEAAASPRPTADRSPDRNRSTRNVDSPPRTSRPCARPPAPG